MRGESKHATLVKRDRFYHPEIVIGVPAHNEERFIEATLKSLQDQSCPDFLAVISDNASSDRTGEICRRVCAGDARFVYVRQESNCGAAANFNFLLQQSDSEYFMWLGAHDLLHPELLERHLAALDDNPGYSLSYSYTEWIDGNDQPLTSQQKPWLLWIEENGRPTNITDGSSFDGFDVSPWVRYVRASNGAPECTAVCGVIRRTVLADVDIVPVAGCDYVILSHLLFYGPFHRENLPLYVRREILQRDSTYMERITGSDDSTRDCRALGAVFIKDFWRLRARFWEKALFFPYLLWTLDKTYAIWLWRIIHAVRGKVVSTMPPRVKQTLKRYLSA